MKPASLLSTAMLLAAAPSVIAIPLTSSGTKKDSIDLDNEEYIVVLKAEETRSWTHVFADMGFNDTKRHTQNGAISTHGVKSGITYATKHGVKLRTFGNSFRAFTMKMPKSHSVDLLSMPSIAFLEKNNIRSKQMPHRPNSKRATHGAMRRVPRGVDDWKGRRFDIIKRQELIDGSSPHNRTMPTIGLIPVNGTVPTNGTRPTTGHTLILQNTAPWNLQRISSAHSIPADGRRITELTYKYRFDSTAGKGVDAYIIDSGIYTSHPDFQGRAEMIYSAFDDDGEDGDGHGTHVAGTVGSLTYGVAKNVNLLGCKVLDDTGDGSDAAIAAGIDAALASHMKRKNKPGFVGSVMNLSLGSPKQSQVLYAVLKRAADAGMHIAVAPGNDNKDACTDFPAGYNKKIPSLFVVGASDIDDLRADFSDNGPCVDLHAPGVGIVSSTIDGKHASKEGTSMATPAVVGVIAAELSKNPQFKLDPIGMKKHILSLAEKGVLKTKPNDDALNGGMVLLNTGFPGDPSA
ncbi:serine protease [Orbilia ellipsospora]|uniref:Serine protease n=1 Tax=Orbilia ellipsospora TaxID=2528407 RepID=A0AAV9XKY0_9PEZI